MFPRILRLAECWEPRIFFIQGFTPVNICRSLHCMRKNRQNPNIRWSKTYLCFLLSERRKWSNVAVRRIVVKQKLHDQTYVDYINCKKSAYYENFM